MGAIIKNCRLSLFRVFRHESAEMKIRARKYRRSSLKFEKQKGASRICAFSYTVCIQP